MGKLKEKFKKEFKGALKELSKKEEWLGDVRESKEKKKDRKGRKSKTKVKSAYGKGIWTKFGNFGGD